MEAEDMSVYDHELDGGARLLTHKPSAGRVHESRKVRPLHNSNSLVASQRVKRTERTRSQ